MANIVIFNYNYSMDINNYFGSKGASGAYQKIIAAMPEHDTYIETHLGSGAILYKKPLANNNIAIDIDANIIQAHKEKKIKNINYYVSDALAFLKSFNFKKYGRTLIYSDPPYIHETRTSNKRYKYEYTIKKHIELLEFYKTLQGVSIILSGYHSAIYDELLSDWNKLSFQVMSHGGVRTECLWLNFKVTNVFWTTFAGKNFTDRQRIKRKSERWAKNYKSLPDDEKLAILNALLTS